LLKSIFPALNYLKTLDKIRKNFYKYMEQNLYCLRLNNQINDTAGAVQIMRTKKEGSDMKMRKFAAIVLALVMTISMLSTAAFAAGDPTFRGAEIEAKAGETITYDVYIENNPGIAGYMVMVDFSEDAFDLGTQEMDEMENTLKISTGDFVLNSDSFGYLTNNTTAYGCVVLWSNTEEIAEDGTAFSVTLKVSDDAINGEHAVKIRYSPINTIDGEYNLVAFETVDGSVTVKGGVDGTINNEEVGPSEAELEQMEEGTLTELGGTVAEGQPAVQIESGNQLDVNGENAEDVDSPNQDADVDADDGKGMDVLQIVLIVAGILVAIVVAVLVAVKAKAKKAAAAIGVIPESDDREMEIEEVMGWDDADADVDDDEDDED